MENLTVSLLTTGEGWHNYHHTFPWDYKTSELGPAVFNMSRVFIEQMHKLGQVIGRGTIFNFFKNFIFNKFLKNNCCW